jgi:hypothetical protein
MAGIVLEWKDKLRLKSFQRCELACSWGKPQPTITAISKPRRRVLLRNNNLLFLLFRFTFLPLVQQIWGFCILLFLFGQLYIFSKFRKMRSLPEAAVEYGRCGFSPASLWTERHLDHTPASAFSAKFSAFSLREWSWSSLKRNRKESRRMMVRGLLKNYRNVGCVFPKILRYICWVLPVHHGILNSLFPAASVYHVWLYQRKC